MQSVQKHIEYDIKNKPRGTLLFPEDFSIHGSPEAVRQSLVRLENKDFIIRVTQGIYARPAVSKYIGILTPSAEDVAEAIIKRDKIRTIPTGSYALNALGLSTQVPTKLVLLTDGSPRTVKVGNRTIKFKKTTPKNLMAKGQISRLVIQALKEIGNEKVTYEEENKILNLLQKEEPELLQHDIALAPVWIQRIMKKAL